VRGCVRNSYSEAPNSLLPRISALGVIYYPDTHPDFPGFWVGLGPPEKFVSLGMGSVEKSLSGVDLLHRDRPL